MAAYRLALMGVGVIAKAQHLPAIAANPAFDLVALASRAPVSYQGLPQFGDLDALLRDGPEFDALALCTPPQGRAELVRKALSAGKHVLMEKPPTPSVSEFLTLEPAAQAAGRVLFATWHSRFNRGVAKAKELLAKETLARLTVTWKEDVNRWHPGQEWVWHPGGFGVFDPTINAFSILTEIFPDRLTVASADLAFPANRDTPIAARLVLADAHSPKAQATVEVDWLQRGEQTWTIDVVTESGLALTLTHGGTKLWLGGQLVIDESDTEYPEIYARFKNLLDENRSEVDGAPLHLVADAFLMGKRHTVAAFDWDAA